MHCPLCKIYLGKTLLSGVEVHYCSRCYGLWFEEDELQMAKDAKDRDLRWLDIDLWKDIAKFRLARARKLCPKDRLPLYEVQYGDSIVKVDVCNVCHGIWLDRGEFKQIISYLKEKADHEALYHYAKNLKEELWEIFEGPEILKEEILDFLTIVKLLRYKFAVHFPRLFLMITAMPR
ncbi:MAG: zf-TFIIB domain-containing protein [Candidatus Wildermuthbacteria bacterium]|nr:zf-TFIIB domain-containing protein [Candidatus Wildermuthbacteria bacterium]